MTEDQKALILETIDLMSRVFWGIDAQFTQTLWDDGLSDFLKELNEFVDGTIDSEIDEMNRIKEAFDSADDLHSELNINYVTLFVNAKEGLQVPLYQSGYLPGSSGLMGTSSVGMKELFEQQGLSLAKCHNEPADHLSIELEYLYFVLKKGWEEEDEKRINEAKRFVNEQLKGWVGDFAMRLRKADTPLIYSPFASILDKVLKHLGE